VREKKDHRFEVEGIENPTKVLDELWTSLNNRQKVSINLLDESLVRVLEIEGLSVVWVHVPRAGRRQQPVYLRGNIVTGIYPMLPDDTCCFLAMDFDKEEWQNDISVLRDVCLKFNVPVAVERSRSGKGGHIWFFSKIEYQRL